MLTANSPRRYPVERRMAQQLGWGGLEWEGVIIVMIYVLEINIKRRFENGSYFNYFVLIGPRKSFPEDL